MEKVLALVLVVYVGSSMAAVPPSKIKADHACEQYIFQEYESLKDDSIDTLMEDTSRKIAFNENKGNHFLLKRLSKYTWYPKFYYKPIAQEMDPQKASKGSVLSYEGIPSLLVSKDGEDPIEYHMTLFDIAFITHSGNAASPPYVRVMVEFGPEEGVAAPPLAVIFFAYKGAEGDQINKPLSSFLTKFSPKQFPPNKESENDFPSDPIPVDLDMMRDALKAATNEDVKIYYEASDPQSENEEPEEVGMELREVIVKVKCQYVSADLMRMYKETVLDGARGTE